MKLAIAAAVLAGGTVLAAELPLFQDSESDRERAPQREAVVEHREGMAAWQDCVRAAVEAAQAVDVLEQCGTKPHPPGKALGWDAEKVSRGAQHRVDKAAGVGKRPKGDPESERSED